MPKYIEYFYLFWVFSSIIFRRLLLVLATFDPNCANVYSQFWHNRKDLKLHIEVWSDLISFGVSTGCITFGISEKLKINFHTYFGLQYDFFYKSVPIIIVVVLVTNGYSKKHWIAFAAIWTWCLKDMLNL